MSYSARVSSEGPKPGRPSASSDEPGEAAASQGEQERARITSRAGVVAAGTLTSRLLGLVRDQVLAAAFTRAATDVFFVAFVIPNVLRQLLAEGATQNGVLPVLAKTRENEGDEALRDLYRALRGASLVILGLVTVLGIVFAPQLVDLFASGYRQHGEQYERTVHLTRWVFPYIFFMGTAALGVAALNTYKRFVVTSFAPALLNVSFIGFALLLPGWLGARGHDRILAMAAGALVGGALQVVAQWPSLKAVGLLQMPRLNLSHPGVREVFRRMAPVLFGTGIYFIDVFLARRFLSELEVGSQSYFAWALRLCDFPQGILIMALQTASLPSLAALAARGDNAELSKTFAYGMRLALFVGIAATALVVALSEPLVVAVFQRGEFDATASRETAQAFIAQGMAIWVVACVRQLVAVYYAMGDTRTPVIVAGIDLTVFVALALSLRGPFGHVGVSLAVSGAALVQMCLLWVLLRRRLDDVRFFEIARSAAKTLLAAGAAAAAGLFAARAVSASVGAGLVERMLPGIVGALVFGGAFLAVARILKSDELASLTNALIRRRRGTASGTTAQS